MMRLKHVLLLLILWTSTSMCSRNELVSPEELKTYVMDVDNGLIKKAELNAFSIQVIYRPADLLVYQELKRGKADSETLRLLRTKYAPYHYFVLRLSTAKSNIFAASASYDEYSQMINTLSFRMGDYVNLTTDRDTIPTEQFVLNRTYGLSGATDLLFVFQRPKDMVQKKVTFNVKEFGLGIGNQSFDFFSEDLNAVPGVNFNFK